MQLAYRYSTTCAATMACVIATGGLLALAEVGATDAVSRITALMTGIPWSLAFRWQPDELWGSALCTLAAVALNVAILWRFGGRLPH